MLPTLVLTLIYVLKCVNGQYDYYDGLYVEHRKNVEYISGPFPIYINPENSDVDFHPLEVKQHLKELNLYVDNGSIPQPNDNTCSSCYTECCYGRPPYSSLCEYCRTIYWYDCKPRPPPTPPPTPPPVCPPCVCQVYIPPVFCNCSSAPPPIVNNIMANPPVSCTLFNPLCDGHPSAASTRGTLNSSIPILSATLIDGSDAHYLKGLKIEGTLQVGNSVGLNTRILLLLKTDDNKTVFTYAVATGAKRGVVNLSLCVYIQVSIPAGRTLIASISPLNDVTYSLDVEVFSCLSKSE